MEISFSCPCADYNDVESGLESISLKSVSSGDDEVKTPLQSISLNSRNLEPTILKSLGSGRMVVAKSVSFKESKLESIISQMSSSIEKDKDVSIQSINKDREKDMETCLKLSVIDPKNRKHETKVKLQKVYRRFGTRRRLAYCALPAELSWCKLLDSIELEWCSKSYFDIKKHETSHSRWSRVKTKVAKVGKGLSKNDKARKLALQHWLEAIDPLHRYGHNLRFYFKIWLQCPSREPFFYWLDIGEGKGVSLDDKCPRSTLEQQCIKYLVPMERLDYEVIVEDGKFYKQTGELLHAAGDDDMKWIFVLNTSKTLYVGEKKKGAFQHSSFLAGGATTAAGKLVVENGTLKAISPHSGHYRPTEQNFNDFITFLKENDVDLTDVKVKTQNNEFFVKDFLLDEKKRTFFR